MVDFSPEMVVAIMFGAVFIGVFLGYPLPFIVGGIAMVVGFLAMGPGVFSLLRVRLWGMMISYILLAIPLFIFMGSMVEKSGCAEGLYHGLYLAFGRLRGGLAIATVLMGTVLAACVGIIAASVITLGLIGIPSMLGSYYFPELLMAFKSRYPELKLTVEEAGTRDIQRLLDTGELDLGIIVRDQLSEHLESELFLREEMVVCVAPDHRFAKQQRIELDELFAEPLVLFKPGYFHREFIDRLAFDSGNSLQVEFETNLISLIRSIVRKGFGVTTFLKMVVDDDPTLLARSFAEPVWLDLCIAWKRDRYLSHADRQFVQFLIQHSGDGGDGKRDESDSS